MAYFIKHRNGSELFKSGTAATLKEALREAVKGGADLGGADLGGAYLGGADLGGADLGGAYLGGADLGGADLGGAYLGGADLGNQWIVQGPARSDSYFFFLQQLKEVIIWLTPQARQIEQVPFRTFPKLARPK